MWPETFLTHLRGLLLSLSGIIATISLSLNGQLDWYIHPRYLPFTISMSVITLIVAVTAGATLFKDLRRTRQHPARPPTPAEDHTVSVAASPLRTVVNVLIIAVTVTALFVLPQTPLSTATVAQRNINSTVTGSIQAADTPGGSKSSGFDVKEWSQLLLAHSDEHSSEQIIGREASMLGFVSPDPENEDTFYVTRFVVTHCVIDAQPVGVPVYQPGWQHTLTADDWVKVSGVFSHDPNNSGSHPVVFTPSTLTPVNAPKDPYVF